MKEPIFAWDKETGVASCIIDYNNRQFVGLATCHPDDKDMQSALTGQTIAEHRATIEYLKYVRDCEIKPELKALNQLYYTMNHSTHFNPNSYENRRLQASIRMTKNDLTTINKMIKDERQNLYQYINQKDAMYRIIRSKRFVEGQEKINHTEENV